MDLFDEIRKCNKCEGRILYKPKPLILGDPYKSPVVFISEEPTKEARDYDFYEHYLGEKNERFHDKWMPRLSIDENWLRNNVYITHVYKCHSGFKKTEKGKRDKICKHCIEWLDKEKEYFQNKIIVTFGDYAFSSITNMKVGQFYKEKFIKNKHPLGNNTIYILPHPSGNNTNIYKYTEEIDKRLNEINHIIHK